MPTKMNERLLRVKDTMRREYDMHGGVRGKYAGRFKKDVVMVPLAPDVAAAFPDADSVNEALRIILKAARKSVPSGR
ncbi:MAG: hypothetical protein WCA10_19000 [Terracidiphilus sp.]